MKKLYKENKNNVVMHKQDFFLTMIRGLDNR